MTNKITVGLRQARALHAAGWNIPTEFCWAYDSDRLLGKIWRVFHKTEDIHSIDQKDFLPAAPTAEELIEFIKKKQPQKDVFTIEVEKKDKLANTLASYVLKNKLLDRAYSLD